MQLPLLPLVAGALATGVSPDAHASTPTTPKLNLTAATTVDNVGVIQCWQLDLKTPVLRDQDAVGYQLGNFVNTTLITAPHTHFPGTLAESYSLLTIVRGAIHVPSANYTLRPGRDSTLITAIKGPDAPTNFSTVIEGPFYVVQQYTDTVPEHTVLYEGACKEEDLPE